MLDIEIIKNDPEGIKRNALNRGIKVNIERILELDEHIRNHKKRADDLRSKRNSLSKDKNITDEKIAEVKKIKNELSILDNELSELNTEYHDLMMQVPNITHPDTPLGKDDTENKEIKKFKEPTQFDFEPKNHLELGKKHDLLDFERGAEVTGSGFYFLKNESALLELALINYAMDSCLTEGFKPMLTPDLARRSVLSGTGYNPRGKETQIYNIEDTDLSLIATSEITLSGYYQNHTFKKGELDTPKKIVALSHCFRTEAGSYGRESKGLYRVHQFSKVEMFVYCKAEDSTKMHEELLQIEEKIMQGLNIPYRVVDICTGDLGGPAYKKYDIEAWMPFKNDWGEVTSTSNCTDYQARNLNIKYENDKDKKEYVHMLNGTAIVSSRVPICILENFQQKDGSIKIPNVLHPYMFGKTEIK